MATGQGIKEGDIDLEMATMSEENSKSLHVEETREGGDGLNIYFESREEEMWQSRRKRMQAMIAAAITVSDAPAAAQAESVLPPLHKVMEPLMRIFTDEDDVDRFIDALEKCFHEYNQSPNAIFHHLTPSGSSLLHVAASLKKRKGDILKLIIDYFPEHLVAAQNARGDTALHIAARTGRVDTAEILTCWNSKRGNNGNLMMTRIKNQLGDTALHEAVFHNQHEMVRWLLSKDSELVYEQNIQRKSPLYLAVEKSDSDKIIMNLLTSTMPFEPLRVQGMPPAHAAVAYKKLDALRKMSQESPRLVHAMKDAEGGNPLHLAAYQNSIDAVKILLEHFPNLAYQQDTDGNLPIHIACKMGHVDTIQMLLWPWLDPTQFINRQGRNILHVSAKYGRTEAVIFMLRDSRLEVLINERDNDGNTPLHLAVMYSQPKTLAHLSRNSRVKLDLLNNECLTSFDVAMQRVRTKTTFRKWLIAKVFWSTLSSTPFNSKDQSICNRRGLEVDQSLHIKITKQEVGHMLNKAVDTLLIVATLAVGVTFAAGFIVPGGSSNSFHGSLLNKIMFHIFAICNGLAIGNSLLSVLLLIWVQLIIEDQPFGLFMCAIAPLPIGLVAMSFAFIAGISMVVNELTLLWATILFGGSIFLIIGICGLIAVYSLVMPGNNPLLRTFNLAIIDIFDFLMRSFPVQFMEEEDSTESNSASALASASELQ